jgi:tyrosyl-tRNA synthetase
VKMGKSVGGALWLDPDKTSPYQFHQWWMQLPDADVGPFLRQFTFRPIDECASIEAAHAEAPHRREGQRTLARDVTALVHGEAAAVAAEAAAAILFGGDPTAATPEVLATLAAEVPTTRLSPADLADPVVALVRTGLATSNSDARRLLGPGSVKVNSHTLGPDSALTSIDALHGRWLLLRKGKSTYHLVEIVPA